MSHAPIKVSRTRVGSSSSQSCSEGNGDVSGTRFRLVGLDSLDKNGVERIKVFRNRVGGRIARLSESVLSDIIALSGLISTFFASPPRGEAEGGEWGRVDLQPVDRENRSRDRDSGMCCGGEAVIFALVRAQRTVPFMNGRKGRKMNRSCETKDHSSLSKCSSLISTFSLLVSSISPARNTSSRIAYTCRSVRIWKNIPPCKS